METILNRLKLIKQRNAELQELTLKPEVLKDNRLMASYGKELANLGPIVEKAQEFEQLLEQEKQTQALVKESEPELRELAEMELSEIEDQLAKLQAEIAYLLIPRDPRDDHNAIVEIRGAAGGDEGNIFAGDLYRMYIKYLETKGWKYEIMEASEADLGGFSLISFFVKGKDAYRFLKFESGAHRVQRVPKTETQGRVHTSTATVLVLAEAEEAEIDLDIADLEIDTHRSSGAGGQHVNKTDSAVRITHKPTGITVNCQDGRSQHENKATAMRLIRARVLAEYQRLEAEKAGAERREKIGTGDRSEKIRTYNYPQNRVTDHRIGLTLNQLDRIMEGKLDEIIEALLTDEHAKKLAGN